MKRIRIFLTALIVGGFMFFTSSPVFAEQALAEVTCATADGTEQTFSIGWDNSNQFFNGRGEIPRLYCEGGYANGYPIYVGDNLPADSSLRWFNGIAPVITPTVEPTATASPEPTLTDTPTPTPEPTTEATQIPEPTPIPEAIVEPEPVPSVTEVAPEPVLEPTPTPSEIIAEPTPTPSESVQEVVQVTPTPIASNLTQNLEPTPEPVVVIEQTVALEVPAMLDGIIGVTAIFEAAEAFMNIGSDMTPEQREESQSVVVAAVIVGQLAMRKIK
jgi:hypothetical protein